MPGLVADTETVIDPELPYPTSCASIVTKLRATPTEFSLDLAEALEGLQKSVDDAHSALRQNAPGLTYLAVTDANGDIIGQIGQIPTSEGDVVYGAHFVELYVGDSVGNRDPLDAPFWANEIGEVFIGKNGSLTVLDPYNNTAAWIGAEFDYLPVVDATNNGSGLIRLNVPLHTLQTGDSVQVDGVEGVPNARGLFTVTSIDVDHIDLQNSVFDGAYTDGGRVDRLLHITGGADNGSGAIRLTSVDHGYESGDTVHIEGISDGEGEWIIDVIDEDNFDLVGSAFSSYAGGGTAIRYAGGGLFQTIAIGPSFVDYRLRAFADGTLKIRNALIILEEGDNSIILDPSIPAIIVRDNATTFQVRLQDGLIYVEQTNAGERSVRIGATSIWFVHSEGLYLPVQIDAAGGAGEYGRIILRDAAAADTLSLNGDTGSIEITGDIHAEDSIVTEENLEGLRLLVNGVEAIDENRDAIFNSLNLIVPLPLAEGGTGAENVADARTNLDVYSKAEVDAMLADKAAFSHGHTALSAGGHDHGGAVGADGSHTHGVS